jgi:tungstate transport system permease protein
MLDATLRAFNLLFMGDPDLWRIIWVSLKTSVVGLLLATPLAVLLAFTLAAVQAVDPRFAETAIAHGASRIQVMVRVLHEARFGVMAAVLSGFGRVISEVGCALMVGGNIEGETRTITTAIALETSKGDFSQGIALGIVLVSIALLMNGVLMLLQGDAHAARGRT